jgi:type II secretory ATPase GspE/PulE/Tfp pilus assembly ATPase PilB-like protein
MSTISPNCPSIGATVPVKSHMLTGEYLISRGIITPAELEKALDLQSVHGGRIGELLCHLLGKDTEIGTAVAGNLGVGYVRPDKGEIASDVLSCVPVNLACHYSIVPVGFAEESLVIATNRPQDIEFLDELELLLRRTVKPCLAMDAYIQDAVKKLYGVGADTINRMQSSGEDTVAVEDTDHHAIDDKDSDASIIRFVNQIILEGYRLHATDIHFEPQKDTFRIRYRVDGLLEEIPVPPQLKRFQSSITSRIKIMARLDIAEQRLAQDGRIQVKIGGESFDLRVSVLPSPLGEAVNLRLLRRSNIQLSLADLGYSIPNLQTLEAASRRPNGIILVTGPTGSGKTTSLYALLSQMNTPELNILTIEDPIEYHLGGILQMQVHEEVGFTFANALRSILRHDPDVVLVGEMRDPESAEIAIRMAMTGHLVLSTLHTNDAASTIARLIDMGEEPYLLASTIICVAAQRLIRLICPHCKTSYTPESSVLEPFRQMGLNVPDRFHHGVGCENCRHSGYLGRTGIHEIIPIDDAFREVIMQRAPASKFRDLARQKGIALMREDGWERVLAGKTTLDEILRVTQAVEA